jgi:hypothetical protein
MNTFESGWWKRNNGSEMLIEVLGMHESGDVLCRWAFELREPFRYHPYEFSKEFVKVQQEEVDKLERMTCPSEMLIPAQFNIGSDQPKQTSYWRNMPEGVRLCSYCGSIHPDDLIKLLRLHGLGILEASTKDYKWYVSVNGHTFKYYRAHDSQHNFVEKYNQFIYELNEATLKQQQNDNAKQS